MQCVGDCHLWPQKMSVGKGSYSAMLRIAAEAFQMRMRWGMPPLATQCVRGKGSSSAVLSIRTVTLTNENALGNATSGHEMCPRQG